MKKIILFLMALGLSFSLFANNIGANYFNKNSATTIDKSSKIVFITYLMPQPGYVENNKLDEVKEKLVNLLCSNPNTRILIEKGYTFVITYIYTNKLIVNVTINSCPI